MEGDHCNHQNTVEHDVLKTTNFGRHAAAMTLKDINEFTSFIFNLKVSQLDYGINVLGLYHMIFDNIYGAFIYFLYFCTKR